MLGKRGRKEGEFFDKLGALFCGATAEGESGFVNLMRIKNRYYLQISEKIDEMVDAIAPTGEAFREEIFDKLCTFFGRYFCESGSVYFRRIPAFYPAREQVYADGRDMELTWKTRGLYYVKSDYLIQSMHVHVGDEKNLRRFYFDAASVKHRKNNERRDFVFAYKKFCKTENEAVITVSFSENGSKTKDDEVLKKMRNEGFSCNEEEWANACAIFRRQTEADFFIHKDAGAFLREQFDMWMYQYMFREESDFGEERMRQLRGLREIAEKIITFIGQFENELVRVWKKPKFARGGGYVITANKLTLKVLQKATKHAGAKKQTQEWRDLELVGNKFKFADIGKDDKCFLPLDTKYFKDMEEEILACLGDLDIALDGEMIKSDNWQALNTLRRKYEGRVKCVYIDPPFNLDTSDQFNYRTNYKDASWATMLENRLALARDFLSVDGSIFVRCGHDGNHILRFVLNLVFGNDNYKNEIIVRRAEKEKGELMKQFKAMTAMMVNYDVIYWFSITPGARFNFITKSIDKNKGKAKWHSFWKAEDRKDMRYNLLGVDLSQTGKGQWMWEKSRAMRAVNNYKEYLEKYSQTMDLEAYWRHYSGAYYEKHNTPLEFVRRDINKRNKGVSSVSVSSVKYWISPRVSIVSDNNWTDIKGYSNDWRFKTENSESLLYRILKHIPNDGDVVMDFFAGSGTTQAVAQKLGRKWLGVEMGEHFDTVIMQRLKKVLAGYASGISNETEYKGGGAFAYYALEQYEEALTKMRYKDGDLLNNEKTRKPFEQYVFLTDDKMAYVTTLKGDGKISKRRKAGVSKAKIEINLSALYDDINLPVTLANAIGSPLRRRTAKTLEYANGAQFPVVLSKMTEEQKINLLTILRPYLWWGE